MSIILNVYYLGQNRNAKKFADEMETSGLADTIRAEKGNLKYEYYYQIKNSEEVLLVECWQNQEAIDLHNNAETMQKIKQLKNKYQLETIIEKFDK